MLNLIKLCLCDAVSIVKNIVKYHIKSEILYHIVKILKVPNPKHEWVKDGGQKIQPHTCLLRERFALYHIVNIIKVPSLSMNGLKTKVKRFSPILVKYGKYQYCIIS